jgi:antibiotic biosynthesis monooxygenase (ABM) superfamily enzyme
MNRTVLKIALALISLLYVIMMTYYWLLSDMANLSKATSVLLYATGSVVVLGWISLSRKRKKE